MSERPKCSFWNYREKTGSLQGENCTQPAFVYRFHGPPGRQDRLAFYCAHHTYRDALGCREITPEILERARAEDWPFMEWPVPTPADPEALMRTLLPHVRIDTHDDATGTYRCKVSCRPKVDHDSPEEEHTDAYGYGFPHTKDCPLARALRELRAALAAEVR